MKVGVISSGSPDYLIDIVTDGLIRLLGRQGVCLDYNVRGGWGGAYAHLLQNFRGPEPFDIREADVLVVSNRSVQPMRNWMRSTGKKSVALLDGDDTENILSDALHEVRVYFKREYLKYRSYAPKIRPLQFGAIPEELPEGIEISRSVFYSGHITHHFRIEIARALSEMGFPPAPNQEKALYNKALMSSLVGVAVRGNGWDTYRYWEIPYFGAAMLAHRPGIVIERNFIEGSEAVFFNDVHDFKQKLRGLIDNPDRTMEIGSSGRKACMERHLSMHRAKTVLEALA